jgi:hydroxyethylthiazole kinase-like uncharacterized protein yjeF
MKAARWTTLDERTLRAWPLPAVEADADKEERGRVLIVGGSREIGGAVQLAGVATLRAGAGKLVIASAASIAPHLAQAVPEARVIPLEETRSGAFHARGVAAVEKTMRSAAAVLVGPGLMDAKGNTAFIERLLGCCEAPVILDAGAMDVVQSHRRFEQPVLLTPHAGEMAHLRGLSKEEVEADPQRIAAESAREWNAVVALKGPTTFIATASGGQWKHAGSHPGLATSGSGDVLAGLVAGFAARGVPLEQACAWGVVVHALAGGALARDLGPLGFLARELPGAVPALLRKLGPPVRRRAAPRAR